MLSVERTHAAVVVCYASAAALDSLPAMPNAHSCRVAPDELWLIAPAALLADTERFAAEYSARTEPTALVLDQSDGWTMFTLRGDGALAIFAQLSALPLPATRPAFVQGAVAGGPAKILLVEGAIHLLVPTTLRHHLTARLRAVCGSRAVVPGGEVAFTGDEGTSITSTSAGHPAPR